VKGFSFYRGYGQGPLMSFGNLRGDMESEATAAFAFAAKKRIE
jgi:hypothetical protein